VKAYADMTPNERTRKKKAQQKRQRERMRKEVADLRREAAALRKLVEELRNRLQVSTTVEETRRPPRADIDAEGNTA
jgi:translation initiation factor 1 (eIF-1/SUI1)